MERFIRHDLLDYGTGLFRHAIAQVLESIHRTDFAGDVVGRDALQRVVATGIEFLHPFHPFGFGYPSIHTLAQRLQMRDDHLAMLAFIGNLRAEAEKGFRLGRVGKPRPDEVCGLPLIPGLKTQPLGQFDMAHLARCAEGGLGGRRLGALRLQRVDQVPVECRRLHGTLFSGRRFHAHFIAHCAASAIRGRSCVASNHSPPRRQPTARRRLSVVMVSPPWPSLSTNSPSSILRTETSASRPTAS